MTGRHGYDAPQRQNEYFIPGDGISREVIQADICRYLGNDALVRPGNHNGRQGYFIRAYRNLTTEMIADLKADSARWEADVARRADQGYPRASYTGSVPEPRPQPGPSPPPAYSAAPPQYIEPYPAQPAYPQSQSPSYPATSTYPPAHPSFVGGSNQNPYPGQHIPYTGVSQPPVSADVHPSYTYAPNPYSGYENGRGNAAPRYPGPGYEPDPDYSPVSSGIAYPPTSVPDARIGGYNTTPDYGDRNRPRAAGDSRRTR